MIKDMHWAALQTFNAEVRYDIRGVKCTARCVGDALKTTRGRGGDLVAYAIWEKNRDEKHEFDWAKEQVKERYLQEAIDDWEADCGHPDMFSKKLTPIYDGSRPTMDDIADPRDHDIWEEVNATQQLEWDDAWFGFGKSKTAEQALESFCIGVEEVEVVGFNCGQCNEDFDWHCGRFCDHCSEPMCPNCATHGSGDPGDLDFCGHCDADVPWNPHERITLAMQRRGRRVVLEDAQASRHNKIDVQTEFSATRTEVECMDGS